MMKVLLLLTLAASILETRALLTSPRGMLRVCKSSLRMTSNSHEEAKQVAIIGAGAAGLAAARAFLRANESSSVKFEVSVFESRQSIGGIWDYGSTKSAVSNGEKSSAFNGEKKAGPMYKNLRTNLPKELMAFREFPWTSPDESYVTHSQVNKYLNDYCDEFGLRKCVKFGCSVKQLTVLDDKSKVETEWPQISIQWKHQESTRQQIFDTVCICNGHYALPSIPNLPGMQSFKGQILHAIEYDTPDSYANKTVLCIGARASGADIAKEIGLVATKVYLSDSSCIERKEYGNVVLMPRTLSANKEGGVHFSNEADAVRDIDVIIFCSGYDYDFPFINEDSKIDLKFVQGERRVTPLYEQLWHAKYPSVAFIGLPHSVVPFPMFEIQANVVREVCQLQFTGQDGILPPSTERLKAAELDAASGGPDDPGRIQDTHFLGSYQWDYCRKLAKLGGFYDQSTENYISTNKVRLCCDRIFS
jgi:hypothetical protein